MALAGCVQYGGYNPSYGSWDSAKAQAAAAGGAESDRIAINQCGMDGTWATWSTASYMWELAVLAANNQAALVRLDSCHGPTAPGFNAFVTDAVRHVAAIVPVRAVQIWNEPNFAVNWGGRIKADAYAQMFKSAYAAVKSAGSYPVISAGLAPVHKGSNSCSANDSLWMCPPSYLDGFLSKLRSIHGQVDGVGATLFPIENSAITPSTALSDIQSEYGAVDAVDKRFGASPIWVTETGVRTNSYVNGSSQGTIMKQYGDWLTNQDDLIAIYVWMLMDDNSGNPNYGVLNLNGNPKAGPNGAYCQAAAERNLTPSGC